MTIRCVINEIFCKRYLELIALNTSLLVVGFGAISDPNIYIILHGLGFEVVLFMAFLVGANCGQVD